MDQVLSCKNQEKEEYNPLCSIFGEVFNGNEVKDFGVPRYDIELENAMLDASREQIQVCEPTITGSKPSLKLQQNGKSIYINPIWAFVKDKFHGFRYRVRYRGRIVFKQGRSLITNGEYALENSLTNLCKQGEDDVFTDEEILSVSLLLGDALNDDHKALHLVRNYNGRWRGRIVFKQGRSSSTNEEYALKNSRTNLFKEGEDDVLWMSHIDIEAPFIVHTRITLNMPNMPLVLV
ncbi:hypothetical protein C5167_014107 [Papaver somniferum]|uniref:Uncharacterized protein n=1 Tax=Papaver somniferum TaxID=3469 RepID=A0A4Y7J5N6_PAPSO|nr:hypothetical protein C5167_014107 [Papaver somniferum]